MYERYTLTCPVCGQQEDFYYKKDMEKRWNQIVKNIHEIVRRGIGKVMQLYK